MSWLRAARMKFKWSRGCGNHIASDHGQHVYSALDSDHTECCNCHNVTVQLCYIYKENSLSSYPEHKYKENSLSSYPEHKYLCSG